MADLNRVVVQWAGPQIKGNAVSVLHYEVGTPVDPTAILSAFSELDVVCPQGVTFTVPSTGDVIDQVTGQITGSWSEAGGGTFTCNSLLATAAAGVGACVTWETNLVVNGRRVRGRTFVVPCGTQTYEGDGTLSAGTLTALGAFADGLLGAGPLAVFRRPSVTNPSGLEGTVLARSIRDHVSVLRSRRY